jgi:hypothetical protein
MSLLEALELCRRGKRVRPANWPPTSWVSWDHDFQKFVQQRLTGDEVTNWPLTLSTVAEIFGVWEEIA